MSHTPTPLLPTPAPWRIEPANKKNCWRIVGANNQVVSTFSGSMDMENARRIVACVNACEGLPDDTLGRGVILDAMTEQEQLITDLTAQRDQLLAALEKLQCIKLGMVADSIVDKAIKAAKWE